MLKKENLWFNIANHRTPKINEGGVAYAMKANEQTQNIVVYDELNKGGCSLMGEKVTPTLIARAAAKTGNTQDGLNVMQRDDRLIVRRLTPTECERLQGFPDGWTDIGEWTDTKGKLHKEADSPRYKALGNSIALPFWEWMAERMIGFLRAEGNEKPTMASLFDGIGGFPLVYSRHGCEPVWASEIEEFPIAVTKLRFPEGGTDE